MDRKTFRAMCLANTGGFFDCGNHFVVLNKSAKPVRFGRLGNIAFCMNQIQIEMEYPINTRSKEYIREMIAHIKRIRTK